jgi:hypothetical protein
MSPTEYERAKEAGMDYILAIVSGLETGHACQVRLIFDPAHRASHKPTSGVRFHSLNDATSIVVCFNEGKPTTGRIRLNPLDGVQTQRLIPEASNADPPLMSGDHQTGKQPDSEKPDATHESGISFFITEAQKRALRERGIADEEIRNMTPIEAHKLLGLSSSVTT